MTNHIWRLTETDAIEAGAVLGRAFASDTFANFVPDPVECLRFCTLLFTANVRHSCRYGHVWAAEITPGEIAGVLNLADKPDPDLTDEESAELGYSEVYQHWGDVMELIGGLEGEAMKTFSDLPTPWRYVAVVGVDPAHQGNGLGSALMTKAIADTRSEGIPLALVTDTARNHRLYDRLGFKTLVEGHEHDPVKLWSMLLKS